MAGQGLIALAVLLLIDKTLAENDAYVKNSLDSIKAELDQLTRTVHDLSKENEDQSKKISGLESELALVRQQNAKMYENQLESQKRIEQLEATVDDLKDGVDVSNDYADTINGGSWVSNLRIPSKKTNRIDTTGGENSGPAREADEIEAENLTGTRSKKGKYRRSKEGIDEVAFSATITPREYGPLGVDQIIDFDRVITNIGNAYHADTGIFTAPVSGVT